MHLPSTLNDPARVEAVETRFASAMASLLDALMSRPGAMLSIKDAATGRYERVNAAMARFLGRAATDICGRTDAELVDPALATAWRASEHVALAQSHASSSEQRFEWAGSRHDYVVLRLASQSDADGRRWLCSVWTDQSPQRQKEA